MYVHRNQEPIHIATVIFGVLLVPSIAVAVEPTQKQMDAVRDVIIKQEVSCSPGSKCFVEKERKCLKLETADEQIRCLDDLHGD